MSWTNAPASVVHDEDSRSTMAAKAAKSVKAAKLAKKKRMIASKESSTVPAPLPRSATKEEVLTASLQSAVSEGNFTDRAFYAYTRRRASGVVDSPRLVFANEAVLRSVSDYFATLLQWDTQEGHMSTDDYDYMSDSDLDDDDSEADEVGPGITHGLPTEGSSRGAGKMKDKEAEDSPHETSGMVTPVVSETLSEFAMPSTKVATVAIANKPIALETVAFKTFRSFVIWSFTGKIAFTPLRSQPSSVHIQYHVKPPAPYGPSACSPKSMYRLAHMFGINELKKLAYDDLMTKLNPDNILVELSSTLTVRYTELQEAQVNMLIQKGLTPAVLSTMPQWLAELSSSQGPQGMDVVALLIQKMVAQNTSASRLSSSGWY